MLHRTIDDVAVDVAVDVDIAVESDVDVIVLVAVAVAVDVNVDVDDVLMLVIVEQTMDIDPGCITALSFNLDCPELILGFEELLDKTIGL